MKTEKKFKNHQDEKKVIIIIIKNVSNKLCGFISVSNDTQKKKTSVLRILKMG